VPAFFALKDAKTPVAVAAFAVVVNALAALALMGRLSYRGLAAALVISSAVNFLALAWLLRRKIGRLGLSSIMGTVAKSAAAGAVMGGVLMGALWLYPFNIGAPLWVSALQLLAMVAVGAGVYLGIIRIICPVEFRSLSGMLRRRVGASPASSRP
jgi:putative peptidoglycan lipid II flippase